MPEPYAADSGLPVTSTLARKTILMRTKYTIIVSLLAIACALGHCFAITADDIAGYLGVKSWESVVALPAEDFRLMIIEIDDGRPGNPAYSGDSNWNADPEKGFAILIGLENNKYKIVVLNKGSRIIQDTCTQVNAFDETSASPLPKNIGLGDYFLFGVPKSDRSSHSKIGDYKRGYFLRVEKCNISKK